MNRDRVIIEESDSHDSDDGGNSIISNHSERSGSTQRRITEFFQRGSRREVSQEITL